MEQWPAAARPVTSSGSWFHVKGLPGDHEPEISKEGGSVNSTLSGRPVCGAMALTRATRSALESMAKGTGSLRPGFHVAEALSYRRLRLADL
jgi:hypothetical protein